MRSARNFYLAFVRRMNLRVEPIRERRVLPSYFIHARYSTRAARFIVAADQRANETKNTTNVRARGVIRRIGERAKCLRSDL